MVGHRWVRTVGPGLVLLSAFAVVGWTFPSGSAGSWIPSGCPGGGAGRVVAAADIDLASGTWFRLDPVLDGAGSLAGQRLVVAIDGRDEGTSLDLPPESFAAGPFGHLILVSADDGSVSRLQTIDVTAGCVSMVGEASAVVRRATVSPDGAIVYESRVDRATRSDLGVWERPLDGASMSRRVLPPIEPDDRFGQTWSTEFAWSVDGDRLAVQSCGAAACRTRVLEPVSGRVRLVDDPTLGPLVGLAGDRLVTYEACRGLPCPLVSTDVINGRRDVLTMVSGEAVLVGRGASTRVVHEAIDETGRRLRRVDLLGTTGHDLGGIAEGLRVASDALSLSTGDRAPAGSFRLVPAEPTRVGPWPPRTTLHRLSDGSPVQLEELTR